ncbi:hypothetical protein [Sphingomonas sp.]|uniref:hypothetical protein n=1 Tax=Sphingomonas sp. TaxID=28214 RepID=UPI0035BBB5B2
MRWMVVAAVLGGCSQQPDVLKTNIVAVEATSVPAISAPPPVHVPQQASSYRSDRSLDDLYIGHWVGVEGMVLDVKPTAEAGRYKLTMQWDLDHRGTFDGDIFDPGLVEPAIVFERNGLRERLEFSDGAKIGLKYLAGKKDCLMVKPGEGYCRD